MHTPILANREIFDLVRSASPPQSFSTFYEYLLVVHPGDEIDGKVLQLKAQMRAGLRRNRSLHSKPHFTIANLLLPFCLEGRLLRALTAACAYAMPKWVSVDGFGNFPNGDGRNVIFIKTAEIEFFSNLHAHIRRALRAEGLKRRGILPATPHLTIAKDLSDASSATWWQTLGGEDYSRTFHANELVVLRRKLVRYSKCDELGRLPLSGVEGGAFAKSAAKQQRLF